MNDDTKWRKVTERDKSADGTFWYSVKTTGVYCKPSCASRTANRKNVRFHASPDDAEAAGFRACKRCRPRDTKAPHADVIARACRAIEAAEKAPALADLAKSARMSAFHFHRVFKAATGTTPRAYFAAQRARRVRELISNRDEHGRRTVTDAIYEAGFNSSSRFYEQSSALLGMTPREAKRGAVDVVIRFAVGECSLGAVLVAMSVRGVCAISLGDHPGALVRELEERFPRARLVGDDAAFATTIVRVIAFVEQPRLGLDLPLDVRGTAFQQRVWRALRDVPAGAVTTYADVAKSIGAPKSVRAVASACGANTIAVAIPCHRVVRGNGDVSGYRWGVERKATLLESERR